MQTSTKGIEFITKEEGLRLSSYLCAAGVWTIGVGHTQNVKKLNFVHYKEKIININVKNHVF